MKCKQLMAMGLSIMLTVSGGVSGTSAFAETVAEQKETQINQAADNQEQTSAPVPATEAPVPATEAPAPATEAPAPATEAPAPVTEAPAPATEAPATETSAPTTETSGSATESADSTENPASPAETGTEGNPPSSGETGTETSGTEPSQGNGGEETTEGETSGTETGDSETGLGMLETDPEEEESETETETDDLIEEEESETEEHISNEELIARQNIVVPPDISLEFRFTRVDKVYGVIKNPEGANIYEEKSGGSRVVGKMEYYGLCYILADGDQEWVYVESGNVRGFVEAKELVTGDTADRLVRVKGEENLPVAMLMLARTENSAYTYTHTTVKPVMAAKVYAVAREELSIYEARKTSARVTGTLQEGGLCYILADGDSEWVFVESGNARGFVEASGLKTGSGANELVEVQGENNMPLASVAVEPEENQACYYTLTSVRKASQAALTRSAMVNFSFRFLGNPYVWGGTSLTNGCDCSGFTQSIYANFGYSIPRVAEAQAVYGMQIPVSSAAPGDLIFYAKNGYIYHVSMYIGDGQVIHAAGKNTGIITSGIGSAAVWATRIIQD